MCLCVCVGLGLGVGVGVCVCSQICARACEPLILSSIFRLHRSVFYLGLGLSAVQCICVD